MRVKPHTFFRVAGVVLVFALLIALRAGAYPIDWTQWSDDANTVFWQIRLPRIVLAILIGAGLGLIGATLQGLFRNPMADPGLLGVSSGSALAVGMIMVLGTALFPQVARTLSIFTYPIAAFIGGTLVTLLIYKLGQSSQGVSIQMMLLAGIAINVLCESGISILTYIANDEQLRAFNNWRMGSLAGQNWRVVGMCALFMLTSALLLIPCAHGLNVMSLSEADARAIGINVPQLKRRIVIGATLGVGAAVASAGMVWFIGLVAPHIVRLCCGPNQKNLMKGSMLLGASLTLLADAAARQIISPAEIPLSIPLALLGAPLFIHLLQQAKRQHRL